MTTPRLPDFEGEQEKAGKELSATAGQGIQEECQAVVARIKGFTDHLDSQPYIQSYGLPRGTAVHFGELTGKLFARPPVVTRESDDLYTILKNMAHFFRVLGKKNVRLVKDILGRESTEIEDVEAAIYRWSEIGGQCRQAQLPILLPLEKMYPYAAFFLNTIGGRSYLFRRDSRTRLLVNYYSILVLDRILDAQKNTYGLDIRPLIPAMLQETQASSSLADKETYIERLQALREKYPAVQEH